MNSFKFIRISPANLLTFAAICLGCIVINYWMQRDLNADMLSYHLHVAHALWTGSYKDEFMAAGLQGFQNPFGYLPFYWMIKAQWPSLAVASVIAAVHSLNLLVIWRICVDVLFRGLSNKTSLSVMSVLLAGVSPVFLAVLGGSFLDPVISLFVLASVYCVCLSMLRTDPSSKLELVAGLLMGAAAGLKLTAVVPAALAVACLVVMSVLRRLQVRSIVFFSLGALGGALLSGGYWAYHLWSRFGSPVFPFANDRFRSPDFAADAVTSDRFVSQSSIEALFFPFRMLKLNSGIYVEIAAPDLRFAVLMVTCLGGIAYLGWRRRQEFGHAWSALKDSPSAFVLLFFVAGCAAWFGWVGNGRYQLHLLLLVGPVFVFFLQLVCAKERLCMLISVLTLTSQFAHAYSSGYPRWNSGTWVRHWIEVELSQELKQVPARYLVVSPAVTTSISMFLPKSSRLLELAALWPMDPNGPEGNRIRTILDDESIQIKALFRVLPSRVGQVLGKTVPTVEERRWVNELLGPWNRKLTTQDCHFIRVTLDGAESTTLSNRQGNGNDVQVLMACPTQLGADYDLSIEPSRQEFQSIKTQLEKTCATLFPKPSSYPIKTGDVWNARYAGTDIILARQGDGSLTFSRFPYGPFNIPIPLTKDLAVDPLFQCRKPPLPW